MTEAEVRDAATVVLLRDSLQPDGNPGLQVWLLTRVKQMVFAAGMAVFPGGRVDADDADLPFGVGIDSLTARLGGDPQQARALLGAAVRETFEETGVLLSVPAADLSGARADVEEGRLSFGTLLREHGLAADAGALHPWSRWVTPAGEVRRYDTRFFIATLPAGVDAQDVTSESSAAAWFDVGDALERAQRGELGMLPPTIMTLASLAEHGSVAEVVAAANERSLEPVRPVVRRDADGDFLVDLPDGKSLALPPALFPARER